MPVLLGGDPTLSSKLLEAMVYGGISSAGGSGST